MIAATPIREVMRLVLPDEPGPYRWRPEALSEEGVHLVRLIHNGIAQPRTRRDVEAVQKGAWPYNLVRGEIVWSCYEWLAPKTHKVKIEVDRTAQAGLALAGWLREHPDALRSEDPLAAVSEGCEDARVRLLVVDPGFIASFELLRLLAPR